jgi:hypothetical protein
VARTTDPAQIRKRGNGRYSMKLCMASMDFIPLTASRMADASHRACRQRNSLYLAPTCSPNILQFQLQLSIRAIRDARQHNRSASLKHNGLFPYTSMLYPEPVRLQSSPQLHILLECFVSSSYSAHRSSLIEILNLRPGGVN